MKHRGEQSTAPPYPVAAPTGADYSMQEGIVYYCVGDLQDRDLMLMDCNYEGLERDLAAMVPGFMVGEFGCYFVEAPDGELVNVWAINGSVPALAKPLYELVRHGEPGAWSQGYAPTVELWVALDLHSTDLETAESGEYDLLAAGEAMAMAEELERRLPATRITVEFDLVPIPTESHMQVEIDGRDYPGAIPDKYGYIRLAIEQSHTEGVGSVDYWSFPRAS